MKGYFLNLTNIGIKLFAKSFVHNFMLQTHELLINCRFLTKKALIRCGKGFQFFKLGQLILCEPHNAFYSGF